MDMRKLLGLMEATPKQGVTGQKLAQTSGGQFVNRADRLNQAKVDAALGGAVNPATGKPYVAGTAAANLALAKKFSQPAAPAAPANTASAQQSAALDTAKANAIGGQQAAAPAVATPDTRGAAAMASKSAPAAAEPTMVSQQLSPLERQYEIRRQKGLPYTPPAPKAADTQTAQNAPTQTSDQIATAALNAPSQDTSGASLGRPAAFGQMAEDGMPATNTSQQTTTKNKKLPTVRDIVKADKKEIEDQFTDPNKESPYNKDTRALDKGSKPVNTIADFEESIDYELAEMRRLSGLSLNEKAPPGKKAERMVKHIKKGYAKDGKLTDKEKSIAFATAWKQHNKEKVNEGMDIMLDEDGHTLKHIVNRFKHETKNFMSTGFMAENLYDALYDYYLDRGDMPYGIAKAREGDPYEWVEEHFYADMGSQMSEGAVAEQTVDPLSELARLAGLSEDGPGSAMLNAPKKDVETFGDKMRSAGKSIRQAIDRATLPKGMHAEYDRIEAEKDRAAAPIATPAATKADAFKDAMGSGSGKAQADDKLKEWGDSPLNRINQMPQTKGQEPSSGAASSFAPRERERVVSPKIDKYDREKERAEKSRKDIVDRESPDAYQFGRKIGKVVSEPIAAVKSAWHGATDAWDHTMGNDTVPDPKPPVSVVNKRDWKGDKDNPALKENDELNRMRKIAGLQECGDMGMERDHMHQKDRLNVTTNMSSDGTRDVTINAQGDAAEDLLSMLKLAGMERSAKPAMVMIDQDEEMMEADRDTEYENTPDEEYQTVDSIIRQGNDLNREKRQYADKPKLGDNPMAESILDADLNDILESILIRDDKDSQNPIRLTPKSYDSEKGADWSGYNITSPNTGRIGARIEPGKETEYYAADPLPPDDVTGATIKNHGKDVEWHRGSEVDEGWEDVSNFFGDLVGTEASHLRHSEQLRDLDKMRQQYKGTPYEKQVQDRYDTHLERRRQDKGEVVGKDGEPIKVLPPDQWKGGK